MFLPAGCPQHLCHHWCLMLNDISGAELLSEVKVKEGGDLFIPVEIGSVQNDVTGGMKLKLATAVNIVTASQGHTSVIVCGIGSSAVEEVCCSAWETSSAEWSWNCHFACPRLKDETIPWFETLRNLRRRLNFAVCVASKVLNLRD